MRIGKRIGVPSGNSLKQSVPDRPFADQNGGGIGGKFRRPPSHFELGNTSNVFEGVTG